MNEFEVGEDVLSFWDVDIDKKMSSSSTNSSSIQFENLGIQVPQAPAAAAAATTATSVFGTNHPSLNFQSQNGSIHGLNVLKQQETNAFNGFKMSKKWMTDDACTVPQITHTVGSKRPRVFW